MHLALCHSKGARRVLGPQRQTSGERDRAYTARSQARSDRGYPGNMRGRCGRRPSAVREGSSREVAQLPKGGFNPGHELHQFLAGTLRSITGLVAELEQLVEFRDQVVGRSPSQSFVQNRLRDGVGGQVQTIPQLFLQQPESRREKRVAVAGFGLLREVFQSLPDGLSDLCPGLLSCCPSGAQSRIGQLRARPG